MRFARSWWRNPEMFWSEMADYTVFSVFLGAPPPFRDRSLFVACNRHVMCTFVIPINTLAQRTWTG